MSIAYKKCLTLITLPNISQTHFGNKVLQTQVPQFQVRWWSLSVHDTFYQTSFEEVSWSKNRSNMVITLPKIKKLVWSIPKIRYSLLRRPFVQSVKLTWSKFPCQRIIFWGCSINIQRMNRNWRRSVRVTRIIRGETSFTHTTRDSLRYSRVTESKREGCSRDPGIRGNFNVESSGNRTNNRDSGRPRNVLSSRRSTSVSRLIRQSNRQ